MFQLGEFNLQIDKNEALFVVEYSLFTLIIKFRIIILASEWGKFEFLVREGSLVRVDVRTSVVTSVITIAASVYSVVILLSIVISLFLALNGFNLSIAFDNTVLFFFWFLNVVVRTIVLI